MQVFSCDRCGHPVFFENVQCLHCSATLAFLPDHMRLAAIETAPDQTGPNGYALWRRCGSDDESIRYRLCQNQVDHQACNFAVREDDENALCVSCRQTRMLPNLSTPQNRERWYRIEVAKRRLYYTLAQLGLVDPCSADLSETPRYQFLEDLPGAPPVMTGHSDGVITLNVAEADDEERVRRRVELFEPYRTLLGHLRHESGHYYWDKLIRNTPRSDEFRALFGDESIDYMQALQSHYAAGQRHDWQANHVSAYAAAHPWEDWAETWAHYLHMVDLLETAASYRTRLVVPSTHGGEQRVQPPDPFQARQTDFDSWVAEWVPLTLMVNSLNRSLGHNDAYPFALSNKALAKLRFVHDTIHQRPILQVTQAKAVDSPTVKAADTVVEQRVQGGPQGVLLKNGSMNAHSQTEAKPLRLER
jgi:hypothetical protein